MYASLRSSEAIDWTSLAGDAAPAAVGIRPLTREVALDGLREEAVERRRDEVAEQREGEEGDDRRRQDEHGIDDGAQPLPLRQVPVDEALDPAPGEVEPGGEDQHVDGERHEHEGTHPGAGDEAETPEQVRARR